MHSSGGPACGAKGEPAAGAPAAGNDAGAGAPPKDGAGAAPFTGGKAGSLSVPVLPGSGAGKAPCAITCPAWKAPMARPRIAKPRLPRDRRNPLLDFRSIRGARIINLLVSMTCRNMKEVAERCELRKSGYAMADRKQFHTRCRYFTITANG